MLRNLLRSLPIRLSYTQKIIWMLSVYCYVGGLHLENLLGALYELYTLFDLEAATVSRHGVQTNLTIL